MMDSELLARVRLLCRKLAAVEDKIRIIQNEEPVSSRLREYQYAKEETERSILSLIKNRNS